MEGILKLFGLPHIFLKQGSIQIDTFKKSWGKIKFKKL